ncbi:ATP-binding cassette domain-containing protein [Dactylosporangium sp. NPDC051541]|uniref:ATP-binding cassette domain-containing protein n=1 Tax=Dactylosporangium sp. NPDC051541 TaxID=3363977 RepID=UPI0037B9CE3E
MKRYLRLLGQLLGTSWRHYPRATAGIVAALVGAVGSTPALALALRAAVDGLARGDRRLAVIGAVGAALAFALDRCLRGVADVLEKVTVDHLSAVHLNREVMTTLAGLDGLGHLERTDLLDRVTAVQHARHPLGHAPFFAIRAACGAVRLGLLLALLGVAVHPGLTVLVVFAAVPLWSDQRGQRIVAAAEVATAEAFRLQRHLFNLATSAAGGKEIRVAGAGPELARRQRAAWEEAVRGRYRARVRAAGLRLAGWAVFTLGFGAGLGLIVHRGGSLGGLVLAITVAVTLRDALADTLEGVRVAADGRVGAEPLLWLRDYAAGAGAAAGTMAPPDRLRSGITFEQIGFAYPGTARPALRDFSCRLERGSVVAVVGEYGSGKTTLVKLLAKFYTPDTGRIRLDGVDLADLSAAAWRARTSAAFQDFGRFHLRFADTVGLGDLDRRTDATRIGAALRSADAADLARTLPDGLHTQLGREFDGVELSEGQWRRRPWPARRCAPGRCCSSSTSRPRPSTRPASTPSSSGTWPGPANWPPARARSP